MMDYGAQAEGSAAARQPLLSGMDTIVDHKRAKEQPPRDSVAREHTRTSTPEAV